MTDEETFRKVGEIFGTDRMQLRLVRKSGRAFLGIPPERTAYRQALLLYQPQRAAARLTVWLLNHFGRRLPYGFPFKGIEIGEGSGRQVGGLPFLIPNSLGILLGSSEHRIRRAIASYETEAGWEVAKITFGDGGTAVLENEANVLGEMEARAPGIPKLLGFHVAEGIAVLRMPYLTGKPALKSDPVSAVGLLRRWSENNERMSITGFPEWPSIETALSEYGTGEIMDLFSEKHLLPVIHHGDFARWNLREQSDGSLMALDWEWGHPEGMPGLDLAHYFLQDARLVARLDDEPAIRWTAERLSEPVCASYLNDHGWGNDPLPVIVASLAFKQGAGHQESATILRKACEIASR